MGDYIQDKTSIDPELVKDFTVISGHYHRHQTIGTVTYIGSPFTMSFGEANDGLKGFLILNSDGTYTREILNLRKHIKLELTVDELRIWLNSSMYDTCKYDSSDLVWLKVSGPYSEIQHLNKQQIANRLGLVSFKLDLIPTDSKPTDIQVENLSSSEVFDTLIDNTSESDEQKTNLKAIWRELI
jgi:DNA repair exonuclease SbcCD nuclease subunit